MPHGDLIFLPIRSLHLGLSKWLFFFWLLGLSQLFSIPQDNCLDLFSWVFHCVARQRTLWSLNKLLGYLTQLSLNVPNGSLLVLELSIILLELCLSSIHKIGMCLHELLEHVFEAKLLLLSRWVV